MEIRILLSGEQLGPFSEQQVRKYLGEGLVTSADLAIANGMAEWQPLEVVLAHLPPAASHVGTIPANGLPSEPAPAAPEPRAALPPAMHANAPNGSEPPPHPADPALPLTASQKTKRKLSKIVIQPILPLEATTPARKKTRTGKTALTMEAPRPTTSLPSISGPLPRERKSGKIPLREVKLLRPDPPTAPDPATIPAAAETSSFLVPETPVAEPAAPVAAPESAPVTRVKPAPLTRMPGSASSEPKLPPLRRDKTTSSTRSWRRQLSPHEVIYGVLALVLLVAGCVLATLYVLSHRGDVPPETKETPSSEPATGANSPTSSLKTADDYSDRGFARQSAGDLAGAISDYESALALDPTNVSAWYRRGLARQAKGDLNEAISDYTQVLTLDPHNADAFSNRGFVRQKKGDLDGALADYNQALVLNPKIPKAYYDQGLIRVQKGDWPGAIEAYSHAIDLDPKMAYAYYNRGTAKNAEGNLDGAIADYTRALVIDPTIAIAYGNRGFARQSKGDSSGALADYAQALALNPNMAGAFYNRGLIKVQQGDLEGAIADSSRALELDPRNAEAYYNRGLARIGKGNLDGALSDLKQFCQAAPRDPNADFARLYLWVVATEENPQGSANQELAAAVQNDWNSPPEDLPARIAAYLLGHISESEFLATTPPPDSAPDPAQHCKLWYFAGMKRLLAGDALTAGGYFRRCLETDKKESFEYTFARLQLQTLGPIRSTSSNAKL
jgi:tetratricopeptide (TPR) repeat protein